MSGYIGSQPVPQATQTRQTFTATSGQTSFATIGYVAGGQFIQVYLNGVLLKLTDDYTAANGSDIVLTSGAATGDILEFIAFADFTVNNQNFSGNLTVDTDTLYVDSTNSRVGVNNASPTVSLDVAGTGRFLKTDNNSNIVLETTDADANAAPVLDMYRNSASPANGDQLGKIEFSGENSNGDKTIYGFIRAQIRSTTAGDESPKISLHALKDGSEINFLEYDGANDEVCINDGAQNIDFRVEGMANANMIFINAANNSLGIGSSSAIGGTAPRMFVHNDSTGVAIETYRNITTATAVIQSWSSDVGGTQTKTAEVEANGDFENTNASYTGLSDQRLKQDIVDATSQWDDIKALQVRKYRFINHVETMGDDAKVQLGVIAQELEASGMNGLVKTKPVDEADPDGPDRKSVNYSVLYMKAVKALQEAMERIETLEAKVAALEERT